MKNNTKIKLRVVKLKLLNVLTCGIYQNVKMNPVLAKLMVNFYDGELNDKDRIKMYKAVLTSANVINMLTAGTIELIGLLAMFGIKQEDLDILEVLLDEAGV